MTRTAWLGLTFIAAACGQTETRGLDPDGNAAPETVTAADAGLKEDALADIPYLECMVFGEEAHNCATAEAYKVAFCMGACVKYIRDCTIAVSAPCLEVKWQQACQGLDYPGPKECLNVMCNVRHTMASPQWCGVMASSFF